jgi:hypothetical protein
MTTAWITKVKAYQAKHGCTYKESLVACSKKNKQAGGQVNPLEYPGVYEHLTKYGAKRLGVNISDKTAKRLVDDVKNIRAGKPPNKTRGRGKGKKKQTGGFVPLIPIGIMGTAAATGAISGAAGFGVNKLLKEIF